MRAEHTPAADWARLGNAFAHFSAADPNSAFAPIGVSHSEATLYSAAAFYYGGFPASAYLIARTQQTVQADATDAMAACFDLLARPQEMTSELGERVREALRLGRIDQLQNLVADAEDRSRKALVVGPEEWVPARLAETLLGRFSRTNVRAVLPDGWNAFWTPLVQSLVKRFAWEFFPSQIDAIERGLLVSQNTFSLQMPTGSGKTALCETLLYFHAKTTTQDVAVLLVPYRSLASELRHSLVRRLNGMEIPARCAYGGTVPTGAEVQNLEEVRVMVATPEALSAVLSVEPQFFRRISLVICDEGHLLDAGARGISLELLLARMRARDIGAPRFVFVSAIVPNIEEITSWLGGRSGSVVRSDYRPAIAEFAVLRPLGKGITQSIALAMHPHEVVEKRFTIPAFLSRADFGWRSRQTNRINTYSFASVKARAIAAARKALPLGPVAVFAANKRGKQGAVGLTEELIAQLRFPLRLPDPAEFTNGTSVADASDYLEREYGVDWIGVQALQVGAVLHHGDVPQETREVLEVLLRDGTVHLVICTTTLAEGVNLPIRTLVLYSVQRLGPSGSRKNLLTRDIKNLVGRAGRAGSVTKALVICANPNQWPVVEPAAKQTPGEPVVGALRRLVDRLVKFLRLQRATVSNEGLERNPVLHPLIDGIDVTLVDLASEEIGEEELVKIAIQVADDTYASRQATHEASKQLLREVFELRARRISQVTAGGRLEWIREAGTRVRMLGSVEMDLLPKREAWDNIGGPLEQEFVDTMLEWAWGQRELRHVVRETFRLESDSELDSVRPSFFDLVRLWLDGQPFVTIGKEVGLPIDDLLGVHSRAVAFVLQTVVEQATALVKRLVESDGRQVSEAVSVFPDHLRFGVPTEGARMLAVHGLRHRRAAVELGRVVTKLGVVEDRAILLDGVRRMLQDERAEWETRLGALVFKRTLQDVS